MKALYTIVCFCLLATACKKTEKPVINPTLPVKKTAAELLTDAKWVLVSGFDTYIDIYTHDTTVGNITFHPCGMDDTTYFTPGTKKMVLHKGKEKCSEPFVVDSNSTWELQNNDKVLKTFGGFVPDEDYILEKLTKDTLVWHFGYIGYGTRQTTMTFVNRK